MIRDITVDTCVLYKAADVDYDAISLLQNILIMKLKVVFDLDGFIRDQFNRCLTNVRGDRKGGSRALNLWYKKIISNSHITCFHGNLSEKHRKNLEHLAFDCDDFIFVAVCMKSNNKELVSIDSDYEPDKIREYLKSEMGIRVLSIQDALNEMSSSNV